MLMSKFLKDDIFLVSYPRSGNAWLSFMIANLRFPNKKWDYGNLRKAMILNFSRLMKGETVACPRPRVIKTHMSTPDPKYFPRAICLYRDGRDVMVSYYELRKHSGRNRFKGGFDAFLKAGISTWCKHVGNWLLARHSIPFLPVKYEELYNHPSQVLKKVVSFAEIPVVRMMDLEVAIDKSDREKLWETAEKHYSREELGLRGYPGGWKEIFTARQHNYFWNNAGYVMGKLGYKR